MSWNYGEYWRTKDAFIKRHPIDHVYTSPMDSYGCYQKTYVCEDGEEWFESMGPEEVIETVNIKGLEFKVRVKLFRTEFWNTTEPGTGVMYESYSNTGMIEI